MTREEFDARYPALKRLTQEGVVTYEARNAAGRRVFTHFLGEAADPEVDRLLGSGRNHPSRTTTTLAVP